MPEPPPVPVAIPTSLWASDGTEEAALAEWFAKGGATVEAGAPLGEIMVDKVSMTIEAPAGGVLEIRTPAERPVGLGTTIAVIHVGRVRTVCEPTEAGCRPGHRLALSLTFDHRAVHGVEAAQFLQGITDRLATPERLP